MKDTSKDLKMIKLFQEGQVIAGQIPCEPYDQQGHYNWRMGPYEYCSVLATEIFVLNEERDPRVELCNQAITPAQIDWFHCFADYEAILEHPEGESGVRVDNP